MKRYGDMAENYRDMFLAYCRDFTSEKPRKAPLNERTLSRYLRGLILVEKLIGHDLNTVSEEDQLRYIERIRKYAQGTRRVSTQIFQRYIAWGKRHGYLDCPNLLIGREDDIIGEDTKPKYKQISKTRVNKFFQKLRTPQFRILFGLIYYGGLTTAEVTYVTKEHITKDGVFVYRGVRRESQLMPLPPRFLQELRDYAETRDGPILGLEDDLRSRFRISEYYRAAQVETGELMGTSVRDLRTSGIRHVFELTQDLSTTKEFAGVPENKKGWLDDLVKADSYYLKNIARIRSYHGNSETVWTHESVPNAEER